MKGLQQLQKKNEETGEVFLYCHSEGRERREGRMKTKAQQQFEDALESIDKGLQKKGTVKQYDKVYERIGRLREKYSRVAPYYQVDVDWCKESNQTTKVTWTRNEEKSAKKLTGTYCLRTMENGLTEQQIWDVYMTLSHVEDAFRSMKSELGLRPVCHQLEHRVDGHLFITLLAYHIVNAIKYQLKQAGVNLSWESVRGRLGNHLRVTTTLKQQDGRLVRIRNTTKAEESHKEIYDALKLDHNPIKSIRSVI